VNVWPFVIAVVLLLANGFFVAVEFSLVGSRRTKLEPMAEAGSRRADRALDAVGDLNVQLAGAQLGITIASLGLGFVAEPAVAHLLQRLFGFTGLSDGVSHSIAVVVGLAIVVFLHMVVGEMVPKNYTLADPEGTLLRVVTLDRAYLAVFRPVVRVLTWLAGLGLRMLRVEPRTELATAHTAEELAVMLSASHEEGLIEDFAADLLAGVLDFGGRDVGAAMVPRERICWIDRDTTVAEAEAVVVEHGHSRLPVVGRDLDEVLGFVHAKDLLTLAPEAATGPVPLRLVRRMLVVPRERSAEDLLLSMRRSRVHLALVVEHDGTTAGLITLEDLLEELVGDILDESDRHHPPHEPR